MMHGGLAWFPDLTLPDPYYLPLLAGGVTILMAESGALSTEMAASGAAQQQLIKWVTRAMAGAIVVGGGFFPSAISMLWVSTSVLSLGQALLLKTPAVRRTLGLPNMAEMARRSAEAQRSMTAPGGGIGGVLEALTARGSAGAAMAAAAGGSGAAAAGSTAAAAPAAAAPHAAAPIAAAATTPRPPVPGTRPSK